MRLLRSEYEAAVEVEGRVIIPYDIFSPKRESCGGYMACNCSRVGRSYTIGEGCGIVRWVVVECYGLKQSRARI